MPAAAVALAGSPVLSDRDLGRVMKLVYDQSGITLTSGKRELVVARLQKRLRQLGLTSYSDYLRLLEADQSGRELVTFLDALATNHTYFFREEQHFAELAHRVVPEWRARGGGSLRMWCAASSSGQEPYTIGMTLLDLPSPPAFSILASDISTKALRTATGGVYRLSDVHGVPPSMLHKYFERGVGEQEGFARVRNTVRRFVTFRRLNLLEIDRIDAPYDVIFCRNVMIYFDQAVQQRVLAMLERNLAIGGYLFISHSESLNGLAHGLRWIGPAMYRRDRHA